MRFIASALTISVITTLFSGAVGLNNLLERTDATTDVCGEVDSTLKVPFHGKTITIGKIDACLCISTIPEFIATNIVAISASALAGRSAVIAALTDMINNCNGHQTCHYPPHSSPICKHGSPCSFECKDGYSPYPYGYYPTKCICKKPYTECNGKCGYFHGCPSGHYKREMNYGTEKQCMKGWSACGILGRSTRSWECVNTQTDLESCGGCIIPLHQDSGPEGRDCTAIVGVSDVSCIQGGCIVHRCMPGYDISDDGSSCVYSEDKDPAILAVQYGLEHVPL